MRNICKRVIKTKKEQRDVQLLRILNDDEFINEALPPLMKLCGTSDPDPYVEPFTEIVERKILLFNYVYIPNLELFEKLYKSVREHYNDSGFYIASLGGASFKNNLPLDKWHMPFEYYPDYYRRDQLDQYIIENVLYSPNGEWGIVSSDEFHCVIGGSSEFIGSLEQEIPDLDQHVAKFLEHWKSYKNMNSQLNIDWMKLLMVHVFGEIDGKQKLIDHGFRFLFDS